MGKMTRCKYSRGKGARAGEHRWGKWTREAYGTSYLYTKRCLNCDKTFRECLIQPKAKEHHEGNCIVPTPGQVGPSRWYHSWKDYPAGSFGPKGPKDVAVYFQKRGWRCSKCGCTKGQAKRRKQLLTSNKTKS